MFPVTLSKSNLSKIFLAVFIFGIYSCNQEDPTDNPDPDTPQIISTLTQTIGSEGGIIELDGIKLDIPTGTFTGEHSLTISRIESNDHPLQNIVSGNFHIEDLPMERSKDIRLILNKSNELAENCVLAVGTESYIKTMDSVALTYNLFDTKDSSGFLISTIPAYDDGENFTDQEELHTRSGDKWSINLLAISGYVNVHSSKNHFKVITPVAYLDQAYELGEYFENAYNKFSDLGYSYTLRSRWPLTVNIRKLENESGAQISSLFGRNYDYIDINQNILYDAAKSQLTAGHEFFHIVQMLYDPRGTFNRVKYISPDHWIYEAAATWGEEFFSSNDQYVPEVFINNFTTPLIQGARSSFVSSNADKSEADSYGYGMAAFIKFLVDRYDDPDIVRKTFEDIKNGKSAFKSLNTRLPYSLSLYLKDYTKDLLSFKIYKNESFKAASVFPALASAGHNKWLIKNDSDTTFVVDETIQDFSINVYNIKMQHSFSENAYLEFIQEADLYDNLMFFTIDKENNSTLTFSGKDTLLYNNFMDIFNDEKYIYAVSSHGKHEFPFDEPQEKESSLKIKSSFSFSHLGIGTTAYLDLKNSIVGCGNEDTVYVYYGGIQFISMNDDESVTISNNTVSTEWSFISEEGDWKYSGTAMAIFDDIKNPKLVKSLNASRKVEKTWGSTEETRWEISARNLKLSVQSPETLEFHSINSGNEFSVEKLSYIDIMEYSGCSKTKTIESFNESDVQVIVKLKNQGGW